MIAETVQPQLLLARRMSRLGTETAFEVLSKAKALERQGKSNHPSGNRRAGFRHPGQRGEAAVDALRKGWTITAVRRTARVARVHRPICKPHARN